MKNKNILFMVLISIILLLPIKTFAKKYYSGYETKNFVETLEAEEMKLENTNYKETSKQATIYLFRGQGCGYCRNFITFLNSISTDYGKYFKLVSFEVWGDSKNNELMQKVASFTGEAAGGVPYIVIGEKVFPGYIADWDDQIKAAIKDLYDNNNYDVFEEIAKTEKAANGAGYSPLVPIICTIVVIICAATIIIIENNNTNRILDAIESIKNDSVPKEEIKSIVVTKSKKKGRK